MKTLLFLALISLASAQTDRAIFIEAIHQVENPTNSRTPGLRGELGPFQFKRVTWQQHTSLPFRLALDYATAKTVAEVHYEWLKQSLTLSGMVPTDYTIADAWNRGVEGVVRAPPRGDYPARVKNLCITSTLQSSSHLTWHLISIH